MSHSIPNLLNVREVQRQLAVRIKALRLQSGFKRTTLAERSGVGARTLRRFEETGEVSVLNLLRLAHALGYLAEFGRLLEPPLARTKAELDAEEARPTPRRGRI